MADKESRRGKGKTGRVNKGYTQSSKTLAQRRNNTALLPAETEEEKAYNSRMIQHLLEIQKIAANADKSDLVSLKSCFIAYLELCQQDGFKVGNLAAYSAMGMSKDDFHNFARKDNPEIKRFCALVQQTCAIARETSIAESKLNPVIGIFWQRNFDGLRNDTEQIQAISEQEDDYSQGSSYKDKYRNLIGSGDKG